MSGNTRKKTSQRKPSLKDKLKKGIPNYQIFQKFYKQGISGSSRASNGFPTDYGLEVMLNQDYLKFAKKQEIDKEKYENLGKDIIRGSGLLDDVVFHPEKATLDMELEEDFEEYEGDFENEYEENLEGGYAENFGEFMGDEKDPEEYSISEEIFEEVYRNFGLESGICWWHENSGLLSMINVPGKEAGMVLTKRNNKPMYLSYNIETPHQTIVLYGILGEYFRDIDSRL